MLRRTLIAFTTVVALGCVPLTASAFAAGKAGGHGGGGHAAAGRAGGGHAMGARSMGGRAHVGGGRRYVGGRGGPRYGYGGGGYGYGGGDYGCNGYYDDYNGCGYNPGAAIVGGLIGGALNGFGAY